MKDLDDKLKSVDDRQLYVIGKAVHDAQVAVNKNPTLGNLQALDKARQMLEEHKARQSTIGPALPNRAAAFRYLKAQGYKVSQRKVYLDCKAGILQVQPDGRILESSVIAYINDPRSQILKNKITSYADVSEYTTRKIMADCAVAEVKAKQMEFRLEVEKRRWLRRDLFELEIASRLAVLEAGFKNLAYGRMGEYFRTGDIEKAIEMMVSDMDILFNDYAKMDVSQVLFTGNESAELMVAQTGEEA